MRCLAAALGRAPALPEGFQVRTSHPALLERAFQLVLQYNRTPQNFDLARGFRPHSVRHHALESGVRGFHKLLGAFGQRYGFGPDRTLQLANLVTSVLSVFEKTHEWVLTSDGVALHVVLTGTSLGQSNIVDGLTRLNTSCPVGVAVHENADGGLQIGLTLLLDSSSEAAGIAYLLRVTSHALSAAQALPDVG